MSTKLTYYFFISHKYKNAAFSILNYHETLLNVKGKNTKAYILINKFYLKYLFQEKFFKK